MEMEEGRGSAGQETQWRRGDTSEEGSGLHSLMSTTPVVSCARIESSCVTRQTYSHGRSTDPNKSAATATVTVTKVAIPGTVPSPWWAVLQEIEELQAQVRAAQESQQRRAAQCQGLGQDLAQAHQDLRRVRGHD